MSVHAGSIVLVAGNSVVDRIQEQGLGEVRVPTEIIREVGNRLVVDKTPTEPDFTFTMNGLDTSTEIEAFLHGKVGTGTGSAQGAGAADAAGTEYKWEDVAGRMVNITSPWKNPATGSAGTVQAGHLIPGYYLTRMRYRFGVTENATQEAELSGGSFYYGKFAPVEEIVAGNGATTAFNTANNAIRFRKGGAGGTTFKAVFGVIVDGTLQTEGVDYNLSGGGPNSAPAVGTVTFTTAPANGAEIRFSYFTNAPKSWPQPVHASTIVKPGAVRGRNVCVSIKSKAGAPAAFAWTKIGNVQAAELEATVEGEVEREFCNEDIVGFSVTGTDTNGTATVRSKDAPAFFSLMKKLTGVDTDEEVLGWLNQNQVELKIEIQNPKDPATILKTLYVSDALFQVPGTPARVNTPTDFVIRYESVLGTHSVFKGAMP